MPVYAALYRAWRPRRLADVIGQEHVTRTLRNALRQGHAAHAYLFCGPRGTGKTSTARILAAALNCEQPEDGDACGQCERCREVAGDRLIDVQEIDAASHRQVEDIRALRETVAYAPAAGRHKVYILDEVHMLTDASWNTLLKTLEEPPPATSFVLCTTDPRKVLATVVSRCQRFDFRRLGVEEIVARLQEVCSAEGIAASAGALTAIARRSDGGLRDALSILDQATAYVSQGEISAGDIARIVGAAEEEAVERVLGACEQGDARAVLLELEALYADGRDMAQVARDLLGALRDRLSRLVDGASGDRGRLQWHLRAISVLAEAEGNMRRWSQPRLVLEIALLQLCGGAGAGAAPAHASAPARAPAAKERPQGHAAAGASRPGGGPSAAGRPSGTGAGVPGPTGAGARATDGSPEASAAPAPAADAGEFAGDAAATWAAVVEAIRAEQPMKQVGLIDAKVAGISKGVLRLAVPDAFLQIAGSRRDLVEQVWQRISGRPIRVEFVGGGGSPRAVAGDPRPGARAHSSAQPVRAHTGQREAPPPLPDEPPPPPDEPEGERGTQGRSVGERPPSSARPMGAASPAARPAGVRREGSEGAFRKALALFEGTPLE